LKPSLQSDQIRPISYAKPERRVSEAQFLALVQRVESLEEELKKLLKKELKNVKGI
jgi:uncharacterized protein (UPF0335 family)